MYVLLRLTLFQAAIPFIKEVVRDDGTDLADGWYRVEVVPITVIQEERSFPAAGADCLAQSLCDAKVESTILHGDTKGMSFRKGLDKMLLGQYFVTMETHTGLEVVTKCLPEGAACHLIKRSA